jgi:hypothetical protein
MELILLALWFFISRFAHYEKKSEAADKKLNEERIKAGLKPEKPREYFY